ncbi:MAG: hypothetical protein KDK45_07710 [Leptospiraceae bacterium]|nr:hypothetical protein [Leptospiraceae bacterium]
MYQKLSTYWRQKSFSLRVSLIYICIVLPFIYYHEAHLPLPVITLLSSLTLIFSAICLIFTIFILRILFQKKTGILNFLQEFLFVSLVFLLLYIIGFLKQRPAVLFIFAYSFIVFLLKLLKEALYYRVALSGYAIFLNVFLSFAFLQFTELYTYRKLQEWRFGETNQRLSEWSFDEKNRLVANTNLPLYYKLPVDMFLHKVKDLSSDSRTGVGNLIGLISYSQVDPNLYPYIRFFLIPARYKPEVNKLQKEFEVLLKTKVNRGEIEELKFIGEREYKKKKWKGAFWTFYDRLRPRYSKTGYYLLPLSSGNFIILEIRENLVKESFHQKEIREILKSLTQSLKI